MSNIKRWIEAWMSEEDDAPQEITDLMEVSPGVFECSCCRPAEVTPADRADAARMWIRSVGPGTVVR